MITVKIQGIPELQRALGVKFGPTMANATMGVGRQLKQIMSKEPGSTAANEPNHRWYKRHWGPRWRSNPARRPKKLKGHIPPITYGADWAGYQSSETLKDRWAVERQGTGAILGNTATYAPAVQHYKEQAWFHKRTGWVTDKQAADHVVKSGAVDRIVQMAVKKALGGK